MSATLPILESIRNHIEQKTTRFSIELFPDDLDRYNLTDQYGAVLVQYAGSKFESLDSTDIIQQRRKVLIALTVIARSQHDDTGALEMLDQLRLAVVGFHPTNCTACHFVSEEFAGEESGLWQYQLIIQTETWQVEERQPQNLPKFTAARTPQDILAEFITHCEKAETLEALQTLFKQAYIALKSEPELQAKAKTAYENRKESLTTKENNDEWN